MSAELAFSEIDTRAAVVEESRAVLNHHAKSFSLAARFLPSSCRDDAAVAYAFCRAVDDAVDEAPSRRAAERNLDEVESELLCRSPGITRDYVALCERTGVGLGPARELLLGVRSDLATVRIASMDDLLLYCYRVAGTVGEMMCGVLGVEEAVATENAVDLGIGMQLTNICRDVLEDARRGRVYLPDDMLAKFGVTQEQLLSEVAEGRYSADVRAAVKSVVALLLLEAERYYQSGRRGFHFIPVRARLAIDVASRIYREIGCELRRRGYESLAGRTRVGLARKLFLIGRSVISWASGVLSSPVRERGRLRA